MIIVFDFMLFCVSWAKWLNDEFVLKFRVLGYEHTIESMTKWLVKVLMWVKLTCPMWYIICMMNYVQFIVFEIEIGALEVLQ